MMRQTDPMSPIPSRIEDLMGLASGDEKHDPSTRSTLDVLWVLYDRIAASVFVRARKPDDGQVLTGRARN